MKRFDDPNHGLGEEAREDKIYPMSATYVPCDFDNGWLEIYRDIFVDRPSEAKRFENCHWTEVLFPERILFLPEVDNILPVLIHQISKVDSELIVTSPETAPPFQESFLVDLDLSSLTNVFFEPSICNFDHVMFGKSKSWGMFYSEKFDFSAVGGDSGFMADFLEKLGGKSELDERFMKYWVACDGIEDASKATLIASLHTEDCG